MRSRVLYYFISTRDFQIGAPAVAGIGAPSVPSRRTRLSPMPVPFGYMNYEKTEIDSESCEVTVSKSPRGCFVYRLGKRYRGPTAREDLW